MPFAVALFLYSIQGASPTRARACGFLFGLASLGLGLSWVFALFGNFAALLITLFAIFPAIFAWIAYAIHKRNLSPQLTAFLVAAAWVSIEFIRSEIWWLRFPWFSIGHGFGPMFLSEYIGIYGIGFAIVLSVSLLLTREKIPSCIGAFLIILLYLGAAFQRLPTSAPASGIQVTAIQGEGMSVTDYKELTEKQSGKADVIVWPEYAIDAFFNQEPELQADLQNFLTNHGDYLIFGSKESLEEDRYHNTAYTLSAKKGIVGKHAKNRPVHFFQDGIAGKHTDAVTTHHGKIGTPICFDCDYEKIIRRMTKNGAEWIAAPTMDAEHWTARQHLQHAEIVRHRARENGRSMVVAATSGKTQFIDHKGRTYAALPLMQEGVLGSRVVPMQHLTFYTQVGWLFPWLCIAATFIALSWLMTRRAKHLHEPAAAHQNHKSRCVAV